MRTPVARRALMRAELLVADWVARDVPGARTHLRAPAGAVAGGHRRVPAQAGDHGEYVPAIGVGRNPATPARLAPALEGAGGVRGVEQPGTVHGVADGARAVIPAVPPLAVASAPDVGLLLDLVRSGDRVADGERRVLGRDGQPVDDLRLAHRTTAVARCG